MTEFKVLPFSDFLKKKKDCFYIYCYIRLWQQLCQRVFTVSEINYFY